MDNQLHAAAQAQRGFFPKSRIAVSLLFLMNGFLVGCWAPKIPEFAERLAITKFDKQCDVGFANGGAQVALAGECFSFGKQIRRRRFRLESFT